MAINGPKFLKISDTMRQYRRADLRDFEEDLGTNPLSKLYCDPLPGDGVLNSVTSSNTTFLLGRKGTGKSTVFAKAQDVYRERRNVIPIYIDAKSINDLASNKEGFTATKEVDVDKSVLHAHMLRKRFLSSVVTEIISNISQISEEMSIWDRWSGKKRNLEDLRKSFEKFKARLAVQKFEETEIPILKMITNSSKARRCAEEGGELAGNVTAKFTPTGPAASIGLTAKDFDKTLEDTEVYKEYQILFFAPFHFPIYSRTLRTCSLNWV